MNKLRIFFLLLAVAGGCMVAKAQEIKELENNQYSIVSADMSLVVDASRGGKILSFKYKDQEVLNQGRFPNSFGSTFWTSPQAQWNWPPVPEYDTKPFTAELKDGKLVLTGEKSERFGYRIRKVMHVCEHDGAIVITYSIINESGEVRKVAPWAITRVPNGGYLEFDAKAEDVTPLNLMKVSFDEDVAKLEIDVANQNRKINVDGKGWLKFHDNGLVLTQKFPDIAPEEAAPGEAEIQVYIDARKSFVEIEAQGPYTELKPGEKLDWPVRWFLAAEE